MKSEKIFSKSILSSASICCGHLITFPRVLVNEVLLLSHLTYGVNRIAVVSQSLHTCTGGAAMCSV